VLFTSPLPSKVCSLRPMAPSSTTAWQHRGSRSARIQPYYSLLHADGWLQQAQWPAMSSASTVILAARFYKAYVFIDRREPIPGQCQPC